MDTNRFWMEDDNFQKLYLLLEQGQFELVGYDTHAPKQDLKLVYLTNDAAEVMLQLAQEAHDTTLFRWLKLYQKYPARFLARRLARMFRQIDHAEVVDLLTAKLAQAASVYPQRFFPVSACNSVSQQITALYDRAETRRQQLSRQGIHADLLKEEPFQYADDSMEYKVHLMIWKQQGKNRVVEIETFCQ